MTGTPPADLVVVQDEVRDALDAGLPVVALESTIIAHGLPRPGNLEGRPSVRADPCVVRRHAGDDRRSGRHTPGRARRRSTRQDRHRGRPQGQRAGPAGARWAGAQRGHNGGGDGTAWLAAAAGIRVFATGGIGGVHRAASETFDESADLIVLSTTPITVVSAGVKSILDVPATLERLETLGVAVLGYRTTRFPAFWCTDSGYELDWTVSDPDDVVAVMQAHDRLGCGSGILVANPAPPDKQLDPELHGRLLAEALTAADRRQIRGKDVTPFLLEHIVAASGGTSLAVNLDLMGEQRARRRRDRDRLVRRGGTALAEAPKPS